MELSAREVSSVYSKIQNNENKNEIRRSARMQQLSTQPHPVRYVQFAASAQGQGQGKGDEMTNVKEKERK